MARGDDSLGVPTEGQRLSASRAAYPESAVEHLRREPADNERSTSQRRGDQKNDLATKRKLRADPVCDVENAREQRDGDAKERDEEDHCESFRFRFEGVRCHRG